MIWGMWRKTFDLSDHIHWCIVPYGYWEMEDTRIPINCVDCTLHHCDKVEVLGFNHPANGLKATMFGRQT